MVNYFQACLRAVTQEGNSIFQYCGLPSTLIIILIIIISVVFGECG